MKKLTGALVLSLSLLLTSGCRSSGETRDSLDASTPPSDSGQPSPTGENLKEGQEPLKGGEGNSGSGSTDTSTPTPADKATTAGSSAANLSPAERQAQESCLDKWLQDKKMDRYGHPEGTMYAGGSPLFNEMTGESKDRLDYVYQRQPEAKKLCTAASQPQNTKGIPPKTK
ncbi:hypothetical protein [Hyalangium sp.]|uniref:hypothetical protein n=1 Tax=Hyalangium sp. TaxID=2028555 RepID=UPI002D3AC504|nr:hypothetical protein [Hyalangium sp.]HYH97141.1 hypothetical protein [Hyalangium sp.]